VPSAAQSRRQGEELHFPSIHPSEAGVYVCTCRGLQHSNASRAEIIVTEAPSKPITVTVEEKRVQSVKPGADVTFICTAKSKVRAGRLGERDPNSVCCSPHGWCSRRSTGPGKEPERLLQPPGHPDTSPQRPHAVVVSVVAPPGPGQGSGRLCQALLAHLAKSPCPRELVLSERLIVL
ncbi:heparan sulfate proteoglycan 2, partial [Chelydra serpentina]